MSDFAGFRLGTACSLPLLVLVAILAPFPAVADQCDALAATVAANLSGARVTSRRPDGITISDTRVSEAAIECPILPGMDADLDVTWYSAYPPAGFYRFAADAGHLVTGASPSDIEIGARRCIKTALRARDETGRLKVGTAYFECQAFSRDGGGADIAIFNAKDAPKSE